MSQAIEEKLKIFDKMIRSDMINKNNNFQYEIRDYYLQLLDVLVTDYQTYRKYFPSFLYSLEQNEGKTYSISIFFQLYEDFLSSRNISNLDIAQFNEKISDHTSEKLIHTLKQRIASGNIIRISKFDFDVDSFTQQEIKECISYLIDLLQIKSEDIEWSDGQCQIHIMQLAALKSLLNSLGQNEYFYFIVSMFLDRLNTSEYFQAARDVSEEIINASFEDGVPELGFLNSYHCYSRQGSINASILNANMSLFLAAISKRPMKNKFMQEMIWESIKYFRNIKLYPFAIKLYESIPKEINFSDYERRAIDHSYFTCLIFTQDKMLPNRILQYLHKEREDILRAGPKEAHPWLLILHNIKRLYPTADFSQTGLGFYLSTFESMVAKESSDKYIKIIHGNSKDLKDYLKVSLVKLNETRSKDDIVHDNDKALTISNRLIEYSFAKEDDEAILLAMMLKSDFSLIFQSKETSLFRPFVLPSNDIENFNSLYGNYSEIAEVLSCSEQELIVWLAVTEGKVFQLSLFNGIFIFSTLESFNWNTFHELKKSKYFSCLSFHDEIKDKFGVMEVSSEEHLKQTEEIQNNLAFCKLSSTANASSILIVKDMELALFPHNLILDEQGSFVHSQKPIANILSTEWFISSKDDSTIDDDFTKSILIPIEDGDLTLNKLYDSLESELIEHDFNVYKNFDILSPISTELNIICSHGSEDIASLQIIHSGGRRLENLEQIVGPGKILIFFVCHSGSYKNEYFRNNITSIVKTYIFLGYKAVIAPFWSLHVNIPQFWLKSFIHSLNKGLSINNSVFIANQTVKKKYPTPAAWACMHLYGNPYLSIKVKT